MKKNTILIVLLVCCLVGCQNKEASLALNELKDRKDLEEINRDLAIRYMAAISNGDFDTLRELLSDDYEIYSPSGYPDPTSREKLIESMIEVRNVFPEFIWNIEDIIAAKDKVICRIIIRGVFIGDIPGLPSEEREFEFSMISIMRMEDGKIIEEWQEDDQLGFVRQLGMELAPVESNN